MGEIEVAQPHGLRVERQQQIERSAAVRMIHDIEPAAQGGRHRLWCVETVRFTHRRTQAQIELLLGLWDLLHVRAFILRGFISVQVPDTDPVAGRGERTGQRLQRPWTDRRNDGSFLAADPAQRATIQTEG